MTNDIQKDWQKIKKMHRDLSWMLYGNCYNNIPELNEALEKLKIAKEKLKKIIEDK
jgi:hypothetical protein